MTKVGIYDAKTQLPKLVSRVEKGEKIVITRHGKPVAELCPVDARTPHRLRDLFRRMDEFRTRQTVSWRDVVSDRHVGHRH